MRPLLILLTILLLLGACARDEEGPTPTPTPTPQQLLDRATAAWNRSESFLFDLSVAGRTLQIDQAGLLSFTRAAGVVVAPDRVQAAADINTVLGSAQVGYIAIGAQQWITNPLSGAWEAAPAGMQAPVSELFNRERGIGALVSKLQDVAQLPDESVDGTPAIHLRGSLPGSELAFLASDLPERLQVDLWMARSDDRPRQVILTEPGTNPPVTWTITLSDYDRPISINPPN